MPFDFELLSAKMRAAAAAPHAPPSQPLPPVYAALDYDAYRMMQFDPERAWWRGDAAGCEVQAFAPGWLYLEPVQLFEVDGGEARPIPFGADDFNIFDPQLAEAVNAAPFPGVAGFRLNYPLNRPDWQDELVSFLGASYFRALGRGNVYGLSARGLLLNSWREGAEEFPRFSEFYLERPTPGAPIVVYAALESESVTGAYRFTIHPASEAVQETVMEVACRLYFRHDVAELGIAPLTSMFLFAEVNRAEHDDYRPQVHDSNGLLMVGESGEPKWRPLSNTSTLGNTYLWDADVQSFGLYQRGRDFATYQDAGAHYERRPSARVEPIEPFGQGTVRLIEIPASLEADDNIVACFIPAEPVKAGEERSYHYRLVWGDLDPVPEAPLAYVAETRGGRGGVSGVDNADALRKFVIDFKGGVLADTAFDMPLEVVADASAGRIVSTTLSRIAANGAWRLVLDLDTTGTDLVELRAGVASDGEALTETWIYQWRRAA